MNKILLLAALSLLGACTTPFHPPVGVKGSPQFDGLSQLLAATPGRQLDVIMVHGMCTHDRRWAVDAITAMSQAAQQLQAPAIGPAVPGAGGIEVVNARTNTPAGTINFSALIWSPLTAPAKAALAYDATGPAATNCASDSTCKPQRARLNGRIKDTLLNDCLSDALVYQGARKESINQAFKETISSVVREQARRNGDKEVPLVLIAESLGSKITFDSLNLMRMAPAREHEQRAAEAVGNRIRYLYMGANQLPILSLADRAAPAIAAAPAATALKDAGARDALSLFLSGQTRRSGFPQTTVVAFTDPNDLLSYRLLPENYEGQASVANVLVSNATTYFGLFENPYAAHTRYLDNPDVTTRIMCGHSATCR